MIKNGRRGSLSGKLTVKGIQGHIAYPQLARNPIHAARCRRWPNCRRTTEWDRGNEFFPPTSWQISNIHGGTGASNIIPGTWWSTSTSASRPNQRREALQQRVHEVLDAHGLDYELDWTVGGQPFLTTPGELVERRAARDPRRDRRRDRAVDHRRHQRRPLHRAASARR